MESLKIIASNKLVLFGVGGIGALVVYQHVTKRKDDANSNNRDKSKLQPLISSTLLQRGIFVFTTAAWFLSLKPSIYPKAANFLSTQLRALYPVLPSFVSRLASITLDNKFRIFSSKKRGLITVGASMVLLSAYRKIPVCETVINKLLMNPVSIRMYELLVYSTPWIAMINAAQSDANDMDKYSHLFNQFMLWYSMVFTTNALSLSTCSKPIFSALQIRHIPYFTLFSFSGGFFSPSVNIRESRGDMIYFCLAQIHHFLYVLYQLGFDSGNIKAYSGLANMVIPAAYLLTKRDIAVYLYVFYWIPTVYYFYFVMGQPEITLIAKGVYLGNFPAVNEENVKKYQISHILELWENENVKAEPIKLKGVKYLSIQLHDRSFVDIRSKFAQTNEFMYKCVQNNENVLVHCSAGVSRSASIVTAYLIYNGYSYEEAVKHMKRLRTSYDPNTGFRRQLKEFAKYQAQSGSTTANGLR